VTRVITWCAVAALSVIVIIGAVAGGLGSAITGGGGSGTACRATLAAPGTAPAGLSDEQARNASVIIAVGQRMGVPVRGWVIAIATALQESDLINSTVATDHDSLGLFQQRPSQGWGTPEQVTDPIYAATKFYERLLRVPGWLTLPLTEASQTVQRSAYPDAYAKHEVRAATIVAAYTGGVVCDGGAPGTGSASLPPGFTLPPDTPPAVVVAIR
jgi:hypothetical protein